MSLERSIRINKRQEDKTTLKDLSALSLREKEDFGDSKGLERFNKYFKHEATKHAEEALKLPNVRPFRGSRSFDTAMDRFAINRAMGGLY